jgi:hypothetical protein
MAATYETDFHAWAIEQARRVRAGEPIDAENVAEELESLGKSQRDQLENRLAVLMQHLLKCDIDATIREQRRRVNRVLKQNPSLRPTLPNAIEEAYTTAVYLASVETQILEEDFPETCPYTIAMVLGDPV